MSTITHEPFTDRAQQHVASTLGMWIFLGTEVLLFGGMFTGYTIYRQNYLEAWRAGSEHLYESIGAINTAVLLSSSLCAALAVRAGKTMNRRALMGWILATIGTGSCFLVLKFVEYYLDITKEHLLPGQMFFHHHGTEPHAAQVNLFLTFYWIMTAIHAVHMTAGIAVWTGLLLLTWRRRLPALSSDAVEITGMYWHFVDLVWIFLLPLLYLVR